MIDKDTFIAQALHEARLGALEVPTYSPEIAAAQAALESAFGTSELAKRACNLLGVKAGSSWTGQTIELPTREYGPDGWTYTTAKWRAYGSWREAFQDYGGLIERVYPHAVWHRNDPKRFLEALVSGRLKYATDPRYTEKVWAIAEQYKLTQPSYSILVLNNLTWSDVLSLARDLLEGKPPVLKRDHLPVTLRPPKIDLDLDA